MSTLREQRYAIRSCVKLGKSDKTTFGELKRAFGDAVMNMLSLVYVQNGWDSCELVPLFLHLPKKQSILELG